MTVRSRLRWEKICRSRSVVGTLWFIRGETELRCSVLKVPWQNYCVGIEEGNTTQTEPAEIAVPRDGSDPRAERDGNVAPAR